MPLFGKPAPPLENEWRLWVDENAAWILEEFGHQAIRERTVALPSPEYFPDRYDGTEHAVERLVQRVCGYMDVDRSRFRLEVFTDGDAWLLKSLPAYKATHQGAAGLYFDPEDGKSLVLALEESQLEDVEAVIATTAHELCHVHLLGDGRVSADEVDHEFLTDLLTVFLGLGVFTANSAIQFNQWEEGGWQGWKTSRKGYLPEAAFGYALALFAVVRGESKPQWAAYLASNIKHYFKKSMRYLRSSPPHFLPTA